MKNRDKLSLKNRDKGAARCELPASRILCILYDMNTTHQLVFGSCLFFVGAAMTFAAEPWEDPAVNSLNRLPARGIAVPCETEDLAFDILQQKRPKGDSRWRRRG